jgi:hypothetical protein
MLDFTLFGYLSDDLESVDSAAGRFVPAMLFRISGFLLIMEVQVIHIGLKSMKSAEAD